MTKYLSALTLGALFAVAASQVGAAPKAGAAGNLNLGLGTTLIRFSKAGVTQQECMTKARAALAANGFTDTNEDPTAISGRRTGLTIQIECMNGRGFNAAYLSAAYVSSAAEFNTLRDSLLKGMEFR